MKQKGFTLIELMVALTIGLILLLGLSSIYITASKLNRQSDFLGVMNESAAVIFNQFDQDFDRAGFVDYADIPKNRFTNGSNQACAKQGEAYGELLTYGSSTFINNMYMRMLTSDSYAERKSADLGNGEVIDLHDNKYMTPLGIASCGNLQPINGCDGLFSSNPSVGETPKCSTPSLNQQQSVQIAYQAIRNSDITKDYILSAETAYDCAGNIISQNNINDPGTLNGFIVNQYYLSQDKNGEDSLFCKGNGGNASVALVPNINEMTLRYAVTGMTTDPDTLISVSGGMVLEYKSASDLNKVDSSQDLGWARVIGVELCLIIESDEDVPITKSGLSELQGDKRPTCKRNNNGAFEADISKENTNRYYKRYVKIFELPNASYSYINN